MYKLDESQLEAIQALRGNVNWSRFVEMLAEQRDRRGYDTNSLTDINRIYFSQGRFRELSDLIDLINGVEKKLVYVRSSKEA